MTQPIPNDRIERALAGEVIVDLGHIDAATKRALGREVKRGTLAKWRGRWFPVTGAQYGIGPLKSCWGLPAVRDRFFGGAQ